MTVSLRRAAPPIVFVAVVAGSNLATNALGVVDWLGIPVTAGTWLAGLAFVARDAVHESLGRVWVAGCVGVGAVVSALFSPTLALASAVAFAAGEGADFAVYDPLRRHHRILAAVTSNTVGAVVDSLVFLRVAGYPVGLVWTVAGMKIVVTGVFVAGREACRAVFHAPLLTGGDHHDD